MAASAATSAITRAQRIHGAVLGAIIGDAAAQPSHWIYDAEAKTKANEGLDVPEFGPPRGVFYQQPEGEGKLSTYGDQALAILEHISSTKGLNVAKLGDEMATRFGPGSAYDIEGKIGHAPTKDDWPVPGPWNHHSIKTFLAKHAAGDAAPLGDEEDAQADGAAKIAPVVGLLAGTPALLPQVEAVVRLTQNNDEAVEHTLVFARLLEFLLNGDSIEEATTSAVAWGRARGNDHAKAAADAIDAGAAAGDEHDAVVAANGSSCKMPSSLGNAAHAWHRDLPAADAFAALLRPTIAAPGCNCSRACMAGAVVGAALGRAGIPDEWVAKTTNGPAIDEMARTLASLAEA